MEVIAGHLNCAIHTCCKGAFNTYIFVHKKIKNKGGQLDLYEEEWQ